MLLPAGGEPVRITLAGVPNGAVWIGWNESGVYDLSLPPEWELSVGEHDTVRVMFGDESTADLPGGTRLRCVGTARIRCRAPALRGDEGRRLTVSLATDRIHFSEGARFRCADEQLGPTGEAEVVALALFGGGPLALVYPDEFRVEVDRFEWQAPQGDDEPAGATLATAGDAPLPESLPTPVTRLGAWSARPLRVAWSSSARMTVESSDLDWLEVNQETARRGGLHYQAARGTVRLRRATFAGRALVRLPARLREPEGLLAEDVVVSVDGPPGLAGFSSANTRDGLDAVLDEFGDGRDGGSTLPRAIDEYLLPAWFGLWYDARTAREVTRETATTAQFAAAYGAAVEQSRGPLLEWLEGRPDPGGSLAQPEPMLAALREAVDQLAGDEPRARIWWSVYLTDLLSAAADGPVDFWYPDRLSGAPAEPGEVTLTALARHLRRHESTPLLDRLRTAAGRGEPLDTVRFDRLGPGAEQPLDLLVDVGRGTPAGEYRLSIEVRSRDGYRAEAPLTVEVLPSYGSLLFLALLVAVPVGAVAFTAGRAGARRRTRPRVALPAVEPGLPADPAAAMMAFESRALYRSLPPELLEEYYRVRAGGDAAPFLARVRAWLGEGAADGD